MAYKLPSYKKNNAVEIGFASQKNHICFYCLKHGVMQKNKKLLTGLNYGKGCIRYSNPNKIDFQIIKTILVDTFNSVEEPC
jgi:uncharacterized protein YdhG (YjbR/CyaY superfamily)